MESIEKLHELAADINSTEIIDHIDVVGKFAFHPEWLDSWHKAFDAACDEIEAEITERYMQLPLDADGVPVHPDDLMSAVPLESNDYDGMEYVLAVAPSLWVDKYGYTHNPAESHHVKPRTVEDVLREFAQCFCTDEINFDGSADGDTVAKYAAEIRELMEAGE